MIRIERSSLISGSERELNQLRTQFENRNYLRLPGLLDPGLLDFVQKQIKLGEFDERVHEGLDSNKELCMKSNPASAVLELLLNNDELFRLIQDITQCERIRSFEGRVYRVIPGHGHHDAWHNDMGTHKLVALSLNLSTEVYAGGRLQIRDRKLGKIDEVENVGVGDAIIFRLSYQLEHRITEVEGETSKTAFAGWFKDQPDFLSVLKELSQLETQRTSTGFGGQADGTLENSATL
jgi:hypothetical protein